MLSYIQKHRNLIKQLTKREFEAKYRGSVLGVLWSFITPLLMLAVYTFVFSIVFKARWGVEQSDNKFEFAMIIFSGLIMYNIFSETVSKSTMVITSNVNYVKKVIFPLEILPFTTFLSSLINALINICVLLIGILLFITNWNPGGILISLIYFLPISFFSLGFAYIVASIGVYIRDLANTVGLILNILFYITPIFYPISLVPEFMHPIMNLNPLTYIVEGFRNAIFASELPNMFNFALFTISGYIFMIISLILFRKLKRGFADVL
ncbi:ABC transporter permease [Ureibacillus sp. FSL W8-0352]|uniref:ABC transporter permease n=1 Tax=Ureibacillus sp. FSL W8-0352 TaxID=2954596 RepID=UPI0030F9D677